MIDSILASLGSILQLDNLLWLLLGVAIGTVVGILPGLGGITGMALILPFIYGMDLTNGIALMIGMISIIHTSDTFPSVLLGVPGSAGAQATVVDGYPLAKMGRATEALAASFFSSMLGGIIAAVALFAAIWFAGPLVLMVGSPELLMLSFLGLAMVGILSKGAPLKGLLVGFAGLALASVGGAPGAAEYRYTGGSVYLLDGIPMIALTLGIFALPELLDLLRSGSSISDGRRVDGSSRLTGVMAALRNWRLVLQGSFIGTIIGIIPGLGGSVTNWVAYGTADVTTKKNNHFGKGDIRGVIGPESANNADSGGALIPTLLFAIPGGGTSAVLLGGFILLGITPGPEMATTHLNEMTFIVWALIIANIVGTMVCLGFSGPISALTRIDARRLVPVLMVLLVAAAYQASLVWEDVIAFVVLGIAAWLLRACDWPRVPMLIGFVLATSTERYLGISMNVFNFEWLLRPGVIVIGLVIVGTFILFSRSKMKVLN